MFLAGNSKLKHITFFSAKYNASGGAPGSQSTTDSDSSSDDQSNQSQPALVHGKHDLLVWFEVLELGNAHYIQGGLKKSKG